MLGDKKKSSNRLSGLFSKAPSDTLEPKPKTTSSESTGRLTKVKNRISSATHLAPEYPPPPPPNAPRHVSLSNPTIQPVETTEESAAALEPLEPPHAPALAVPGSRNSSPSRSRPGSRQNSRPGTPSDSATEGNLKKLRRRSKLFGGSQAGDEFAGGVPQAHDSPLAWIAGHKGKVPYNLAMLLNGERVPELWQVFLYPNRV